MTIEQLEKDVKFLAKRASDASKFSFGEYKRDTGMSSNSIISIAYGVSKLKDQYLPSDLSDLLACERAWKKLPKHRKVGDAVEAMQRARECDYHGKERFDKKMI